MARLTMARSSLSMGRSTVLRTATGRVEIDKRRDAQPWRKWYKTKRWQQLRWAVLVRDLFTCGLCARVCGGKGEAVADHKVRHRGDAALFWDEANLWCLCKPCHDGAKARSEGRGN
jgi:5-methylcytosine-specific restriction enzyme A